MTETKETKDETEHEGKQDEARQGKQQKNEGERRRVQRGKKKGETRARNKMGTSRLINGRKENLTFVEREGGNGKGREE